jgi:hypothetical protein
MPFQYFPTWNHDFTIATLAGASVYLLLPQILCLLSWCWAVCRNDSGGGKILSLLLLSKKLPFSSCGSNRNEKSWSWKNSANLLSLASWGFRGDSSSLFWDCISSAESILCWQGWDFNLIRVANVLPECGIIRFGCCWIVIRCVLFCFWKNVRPKRGREKHANSAIRKSHLSLWKYGTRTRHSTVCSGHDDRFCFVATDEYSMRFGEPGSLFGTPE